MGNTTERQRRVRACYQPGMWVISLDDASWAELMTGLSLAIEACDRNGLPAECERAARYRGLRTALSKG